jgi:hypothetical protein
MSNIISNITIKEKVHGIRHPMFYKIYDVFDFVEYFCNGLVLFLSYDHLNEMISTIDDFWNFFHFWKPFLNEGNVIH